MAQYVPRKGDFIAVSFDPQAGHEQKGRRPALVVSNDLFNRNTGLVIACPMTNTDRNFPFHVPVEDGTPVTGFVMVEQGKSLDLRARRVKPIGSASDKLVEEVLSVLGACLY